MKTYKISVPIMLRTLPRYGAEVYIEKLKKIENYLNRRMRSEDYISLNEFYYEVGLDGVGAGYDLGWNIERGYIELEFSSQLASDGTPCLVVGFNTPPKYDYNR